MRSAQLWLAIGAAAGVAIAAASLVQGGGAPRTASRAASAPADALAIVNGHPIPREAMARFAAAVARERGRLELDAAERKRLLSRLIDEELLLQRGIELGLERREPSARGAILSAVVDSITTAESREPTRAELEQTLRENPASFARPGRVTIEAARVPLAFPSSAEAPRRAAQITERARAGEPLAALAAALAQPIDPPLPPGPLSMDALRDRAGTLVVQAIAKLAPGETSDPVRAMDGYWVLRLVAREPDVSPPLDDVWEPVNQLWQQQQHTAQLESALAKLRGAAQIEIVDPELRDDGR